MRDFRPCLPPPPAITPPPTDEPFAAILLSLLPVVPLLCSALLCSALPWTQKRNKIAMLIEQLKADDINLRVTATRSLPAIAEALGPERVRAELVPFVNDSTDDEDEVRGEGGEGREGGSCGGEVHDFDWESQFSVVVRLCFCG